MNLVDICFVKYPGQIEAGNIYFRKPDEDIIFAKWAVPGVEQPLESDIMAEAPQWEKTVQIFKALPEFIEYIDNLLDRTAKSKLYGSALSITTYLNSSNPQWASEAQAFINWRDAVFDYSINIKSQVEADLMPIPTLEEFIAGVPVIIWP